MSDWTAINWLGVFLASLPIIIIFAISVHVEGLKAALIGWSISIAGALCFVAGALLASIS